MVIPVSAILVQDDLSNARGGQEKQLLVLTSILECHVIDIPIGGEERVTESISLS